MDFLRIKTRTDNKKKIIEVYPSFVVRTSKDLMIRGGDFYAIWDKDNGLWSTDEYRAVQLIDKEIDTYLNDHNSYEYDMVPLYLHDGDSGMIDKWHKFLQKQMRDSYVQLDETLTFSDANVTRETYASMKLPYSLNDGTHEAFDELVSTLYSPKERHKIEWTIGAIVSGDSKEIQKFVVFYGSAGTGKSTIINIFQQLFTGYYSMFDARALGSSSDSFALSQFHSNPLVAIQHDGDLSRIESNARLNSVVSHEEMTINEKFRAPYSARFRAMLVIGTNKPVRITDNKSGLLRRLIDIQPSNNKIPVDRYYQLTNQIKFELGAIAKYCLDVYSHSKNFYDSYVPEQMLGETNDFYNYVKDNFDVFVEKDSVTLSEAWDLYKIYNLDSQNQYSYSKRLFKFELMNYFDNFVERGRDVEGRQVRNLYSGFQADKIMFKSNEDETDYESLYSYATAGEKVYIVEPEPPDNWIELKPQESIFDTECAKCIAQYGTKKETPAKRWAETKTELRELDTKKLHYVKVPPQHIVIDFDLKDEEGHKSKSKNLEAASLWPKTYAELSKGGSGLHLHYIFDGDVDELSREYDTDIEVKVFNGNSSLRRKLTLCNDIPVAYLNSGLPLRKKGANMIDWDGVKNEKMLRHMIAKNLNKEYHGATKPSIDYIYSLIEEAYERGFPYDISDMKQAITFFASNSTNQAEYCLKKVGNMKFKSKEPIEEADKSEDFTVKFDDNRQYDDDRLVFFDVEVFPNLFLVNWKYEGNDHCTRMINPKPSDILPLFRKKLVGFNNRKYDNHILWARYMGYTNEMLYNLSKRIIERQSGSSFREAYNLSYTDVYDFVSEKKSLKKFEIDLGIHHQELGLPWDEPVDESLWEQVAEYCDNDVIATEAVFNARKEDYIARETLAAISGLTVNDTNNSHTAKIIFGNTKHPQTEFEYTDLSTIFPGYEYSDFGIDAERYDNPDATVQKKSIYLGEDPGEGGYVYAEPGMYGNVALLDIASMHPTSLIELNLFGDEYTAKFKELLDLRIAIKHKDYEKAKTMLDGAVAPYLEDATQAKQLAYALKIVINSVYGLTSAKFDNAFKDPRNVDNIVAKRGALFMINLKREVMKRGFTVAHIKTDSIKIPDATPEIIDFIMSYGREYGYTFEHEATYDKMCLVNRAVYICKVKEHDGEPVDPYWEATGAQFQHPYVFKTLFSKEPIIFDDLCETKAVQNASIYIDFNEGLEDVSDKEVQLKKMLKEDISEKTESEVNAWDSIIEKLVNEEIPKGHNYVFVGRVGQFTPVKEGSGGGYLYRYNAETDTYQSISGTKGQRWKESETIRNLNKEDEIDRSYFGKFVDDAIDTISQYGDFEWFVADELYSSEEEHLPF